MQYLLFLSSQMIRSDDACQQKNPRNFDSQKISCEQREPNLFGKYHLAWYLLILCSPEGIDEIDQQDDRQY